MTSTRVRPQIGLRFFRHRRQDALTGQAVSNEHDSPVVGSRDATTSRRDWTSFQLRQRTTGHVTHLPALLVIPTPDRRHDS